MNRRTFLGIAGASIFAPTFGSWYRRGSGLVVPVQSETTVLLNQPLEGLFYVTATDANGKRVTVQGMTEAGSEIQLDWATGGTLTVNHPLEAGMMLRVG